MSNTYINAKGTMSDEYRIGKTGITIFSRDDIPSNTLGKDGDYCAVKNNPHLLIKSNGNWVNYGAYSLITIDADIGVTVNLPRTMYLVDSTTTPITLTITDLPSSGYDFVVYDIGNNASTNNITVIIEDSMTTVDSYTLTTDGQNLNLVSTGSQILQL